MGTTASVAPKSGASPQANPIVSFVPMVVVCLIIYMLIIRPQQKQAKEQTKMVDALKPGDKVLTAGGIFGVVTALRGNIVQVRIAENVRVDVNRTAITQVVKESANGAPVVPEMVS